MRLPPGKKSSPFGTEWQTWPKSSPEDVRYFWTDDHTGQPKEYNIAVQTGLGFIVIDFDYRKGGKPTLDLIAAMLPSPTYTVTSPGGKHYYFRHDMDLRGGSNVLDHMGLPGVDLRAHNGYAVGAGSIADGIRYEANGVLPDQMAPLPQFLKEWIGSRPIKAKAEQSPVIDTTVDAVHAAALQQARDWLDSPEGLRGGSCDGRTFQVAARLKDIGVPVDDAVALLFEHEQRFGDVSGSEAMERSIRNAYAYATGSKPGEGLRAPAEIEFQPVGEPSGSLPPPEGDQGSRQVAEATGSEGAVREKRVLKLERWSSIEDVAADWLIDGVLPRGGFAALYGQPGSYKSFIALHLGACIASGRSFFDREAIKGDVLYIMAEGGFGLKRRLEAIEKTHGVAPDNMLFLRSAVDLRSTRESAEKIAAAALRAGLNVELVVVDTMARTFGGGNENSSEDMGAYIAIVDDVLRARLNCCVLLVHHSGKDVARGMRGHNSLFAAVDAELEAEQLVKVRPGAEVPGSGRIKITKQKDGPDGWEIPFAIESVSVGAAAAGESAPEDRTSLAIRAWAEGENAPNPVELMGDDWGKNINAESVLELHQSMSDKECRKDTRSPDWAGKYLAKACGFHGVEGWKDKALLALKRLHRSEAIEIVEGKDTKRTVREYWIPILDNGLEWLETVKAALRD